MTLLKLPPEIHVLITEHFDWHSLLHYRHTCKYFRDVTETLSVEQVWHQVWPPNPLIVDMSMTRYYGPLLRRYEEIYALCLTIIATTYCQSVTLPADISAFRQRYDYVGKERMFYLVYREIQTTRGLSLIALGHQIWRCHSMLEYGFINDLERMCQDILMYIMASAMDANVLDQYRDVYRGMILSDTASMRFALDNKLVPGIRPCELE